MTMNCKDIDFGTYYCSYSIYLPWKVKFKWENIDSSRWQCVEIDKCLLPEILKLWEMGIKTTGCCCGHGDSSKAFISVQNEFISKMLDLGYITALGGFKPKTKLKYGVSRYV